MTRAGASFLLASALVSGQVEARALPGELRGLVEAARPAGCTTYRFLFWTLYQAELWSDADTLPGNEFGLSLTYRSDFSRSDLVESSVEEMARISGLNEVLFAVSRAEMLQAFRDVVPGDRITAWRAGPDRLRIFVNGEETGMLTKDVDIFLAIWLGEGTRHPEGRQTLLSGRCDG